MTRRVRVVIWNGKDVPAELRELPAGRYVVEAVDDEAPALSPDEEAGIEAGLEFMIRNRENASDSVSGGSSERPGCSGG
jgi:hypothetical protein